MNQSYQIQAFSVIPRQSKPFFLSRLFFLFSFFFLWACEEEAIKKNGKIQDVAVISTADVYILDQFIPVDMNLALDMEPQLPMPDMMPVIPTTISWVTITANPMKNIYLPTDIVDLDVKAFDLYGNEIIDEPNLTWTWNIMPPQFASIAQRQLSFSTEGIGDIKACAQLNGNEKCIQKRFIVSQSKPILQIDLPVRAAALSNEENTLANHIKVKGTATLPSGQLGIWVNGKNVIPNAEGQFEIDMPASFGRNDIEVIATDLLTGSSVKDFRTVLWAPRYLPTENTQSKIENALLLSLSQAFLDQNAPLDLIQNPIILKDLSQSISAILSLIDPIQYLPTQDLVNQGIFTLRVDDIALNETHTDIHWIDNGIELILDLPALTIHTSGGLSFQNQNISLDGDIVISISAFSRLTIDQTEDNPLNLALNDFGVTVASITGRFNDPSANAIVETIGSQLRQVVSDAANQLLSSLLQQQLTSILSNGLSALFRALNHIPIDINPNIPGISPVSLDLGISPSRLQLARFDFAQIGTDLLVNRNSTGEPRFQIPGIPDFLHSEIPVPQAALGIQIKAAFFNAFAYELWRGNLLNLQMPAPAGVENLVEDIQIASPLPPVIYPNRPSTELASSYPLVLTMPALLVGLKGPTEAGYDHYEITLSVGLTLDIRDDGSFTLLLSDEPQIVATLVAQERSRPIVDARALASLFKSTVWPQLKSSLDGKISFGLQGISIPASQFNSFGLNLREATITPKLITPLEVYQQGWVSINGEILFSLLR
jgi:hypothetical protein